MGNDVRPCSMTVALPERHTSGMTDSILDRIHQRTISTEELLSLLTGYRLLPQLLREVVIDQAIAPYPCTFEETVAACKQFYEQNQITSEDERQAWLARNHLSMEQLESLVTRPLRLEQFKRETWAHKLESYFLQRKGQLDRMIYALIRTKNFDTAQELYFRIQEEEQSFADLARQYSEGPEAQTGGLLGPVEMSVPHPALAQKLATSQPGQVQPPFRLNEWVVIVRLEKFLPSQLDEAMRQRLLNELFETWVQEQLNQTGGQDESNQP